MAATRGYHAAAVIAAARRAGHCPGMRYRGTREWLIWARIGRAAIVRDVPLELLRAGDVGVADLLALGDVEEAGSVAQARRALRRQEVVLDAPAGYVLGRLGALFGLGCATPAPMVEQFVYDVFQGWGLGACEVEGMAEAFLADLEETGERAGMLRLSGEGEGGLRAAFVSGVERALQDLKEQRYMRR